MAGADATAEPSGFGTVSRRIGVFFRYLLLAATLAGIVALGILLAYVLRIATIAKRTLAIGPFVLRETDRSETIEWGDTE